MVLSLLYLLLWHLLFNLLFWSNIYEVLSNNPYYADIDQEDLQQLPVHGVPEHLPTLDDPHADLEPFNHLDVDNNADQEQTPQHNATGPQKVSHSFIPQQQEQQQEQDAIWAFINGEHPLNSSHPMQEILEMSFK